MNLKISVLLISTLSVGQLFSQSILQEFVIEETDNTQRFYSDEGCTPEHGALVFYTTIPNLKFTIPNAISRLKNVSDFDRQNNCYVLCVLTTDETIGSQYVKYSIKITAPGYKPEEAYIVSGIKAGVAQHFIINPKINDKTRILNVNGMVKDKWHPLIGVSVEVKGTTNSTVTDRDGNFWLSNIPVNSTLIFSYLGYKTQEILVNGRTNIDVIMKESLIKRTFSNYGKKLGIGVTLPSLMFYDVNGVPDLIYDKTADDYGWQCFVNPRSKMAGFGLALQFPLVYNSWNEKRLSLNTDAVFSVYNYKDDYYNSDKEKDIIYKRLLYYAMEVPVTFVWYFDEILGINFGIQNNFHFGCKYDNYLVDYHLKTVKNNPIIKPYSLDAIIRMSANFEGGSVHLTYTRAMTDKYNHNFVQRINGIEFYPLKNRKFDKNLIAIGFTLYINQLVNK
jgi:hypothetical protein